MTTASTSTSDPGARSALEQVAHHARAAGQIALDTEFMGEGRYRTLLCLIQLAVPDGQGDERIEIVDPLAPSWVLDGPLQGRAARRRAVPIRGSRWWCTPDARTSRCCAARLAAR